MDDMICEDLEKQHGDVNAVLNEYYETLNEFGYYDKKE